MEVYVVRPPKPRYALHAMLFLATIFTTLVVGARMEFNFLRGLPPFYTGEGSLPLFPIRWALHPSHLVLGIPFSFSLMLILLAHEMGHYLCCRYYGVHATLPFFIPFPSLIGTMGAFIRIRSPIRSRSALFDIGIAGPIAGFLVAIPILIFALVLSKPITVVGATNYPFDIDFPLIFRLTRWLISGTGIGFSISHLPFQQICFHPSGIAAWAGMFATALNLLPGGQLDGGHIIFSLAPRRHKIISRLTILALIPLGVFCCYIWLVWAILLRISGMRHPMVAEWPGITGVRRWLALFALLMLILTLTPAPFAHMSLMQVLRDVRSGQ